MAGDDHARHCPECDRFVYNLSALSAAGALALIREKEGDLCARFFRRADGTVLTADCPVGAGASSQGSWWRPLAALAVPAAAYFLLIGGAGSSSGEGFDLRPEVVGEQQAPVTTEKPDVWEKTMGRMIVPECVRRAGE
jgi:hypothetical protein